MAVEGTTRLGLPKHRPLAWRAAEFYNEEALFKELERVFDICHGCRRCFNLCRAFPRLFDAIDEDGSGELDRVGRSVYWAVVDRCYLCGICFMTKCPYVSPHGLNVDFPHLMLRAKAIKFKRGDISFRDRLLSNTDALGKLASTPMVARMINTANHTPVFRKMMDVVLRIHSQRELPDYHRVTLRKAAAPRDDFPVIAGAHAPGKVALYATCYINYHEPDIGHDLLKILAHNKIPVIMVEKEACCGMPKLELGDLDGVARLKAINIPVLAQLARDGYAILSAIPSCTLMFKQKLPLLFPDDDAVRQVANALSDPFDYLMRRHRDGLINTNFRHALGHIAYQMPCHLLAQNLGLKTRDMLQLVHETRVTTIERCSGHDGAWGVKREFFNLSLKIGQPVFRQMASAAPDYLSSDCPLAGRHIAQGIGTGAAQKQHPLTLIRMAYGL